MRLDAVIPKSCSKDSERRLCPDIPRYDREYSESWLRAYIARLERDLKWSLCPANPRSDSKGSEGRQRPAIPRSER